jgi:hypothetical protein
MRKIVLFTRIIFLPGGKMFTPPFAPLLKPTMHETTLLKEMELYVVRLCLWDQNTLSLSSPDIAFGLVLYLCTGCALVLGQIKS